MTITELSNSVTFADSFGHQVSLRLRSERNKGTEEPGWSIQPLSSGGGMLFLGPYTGNPGEYEICITHLAVQVMPTSRPAYRVAWVPLLGKDGAVKTYLHLYNRYVDAASVPTSFRIKATWDRDHYNKAEYEEHEL